MPPCHATRRPPASHQAATATSRQVSHAATRHRHHYLPRHTPLPSHAITPSSRHATPHVTPSRHAYSTAASAAYNITPRPLPCQRRRHAAAAATASHAMPPRQSRQPRLATATPPRRTRRTGCLRQRLYHYAVSICYTCYFLCYAITLLLYMRAMPVPLLLPRHGCYASYCRQPCAKAATAITAAIASRRLLPYAAAAAIG